MEEVESELDSVHDTESWNKETMGQNVVNRGDGRGIAQGEHDLE